MTSALLIAKADGVLYNLVMFLTVLFPLDVQFMKYSCYQDTSVIHGWFVYWFLVEKCAACQNHWKSDYSSIVFLFHLA